MSIFIIPYLLWYTAESYVWQSDDYDWIAYIFYNLLIQQYKNYYNFVVIFLNFFI